MKKLILAIGLTFAALLIAFAPRAQGLTLVTVHNVKECPAGLTIQAKPGANSMVDFDVAVDAEAIANNESYKGRILSSAHLSVILSGQKLAAIPVREAISNTQKRILGAATESTPGKITHYQFSLAPAAAKTTELTISVTLFEKDGMPTIGGGVAVQIPLPDFVPPPEVKAK